MLATLSKFNTEYRHLQKSSPLAYAKEEFFYLLDRSLLKIRESKGGKPFLLFFSYRHHQAAHTHIGESPIVEKILQGDITGIIRK